MKRVATLNLIVGVGILSLPVWAQSPPSASFPPVGPAPLDLPGSSPPAPSPTPAPPPTPDPAPPPDPEPLPAPSPGEPPPASGPGSPAPSEGPPVEPAPGSAQGGAAPGSAVPPAPSESASAAPATLPAPGSDGTFTALSTPGNGIEPEFSPDPLLERREYNVRVAHLALLAGAYVAAPVAVWASAEKLDTYWPALPAAFLAPAVHWSFRKPWRAGIALAMQPASAYAGWMAGIAGTRSSCDGRRVASDCGHSTALVTASIGYALWAVADVALMNRLERSPATEQTSVRSPSGVRAAPLVAVVPGGGAVTGVSGLF